MTFTPKEYPILKGTGSASSNGQTLVHLSLKEEEEEMKDLLEQERQIDQEIINELEKFRMEREIGLDNEEGGE